MDLGDHWHGKSRVRVAKVFRDSAQHRFVEYSVELIVRGGSSASFINGDNSRVVSTDTCKNHVYLLAKHHDCKSPEIFAIDLIHRMLTHYSWLTGARASVIEVGWRRDVSDGREHVHGFGRVTETRVGEAEVERGREVRVISKLDGLALLKTTQSAWEGYVKDKFTTLPETNERVLASVVSAEWGYKPSGDAILQIAFEDVASQVRQRLLHQFLGDAHTGVRSKGVQETMYKMACAGVQVDGVEWVKLSMPNLHFLPCQIPVFGKNSIAFEHDVYVPTDEPHGIISAVVTRRRARL